MRGCECVAMRRVGLRATMGFLGDDQLEQLARGYPQVDQEVLLEILVLCDGEVARAREVLRGELGEAEEPAPKRQKVARYQSVIPGAVAGGGGSGGSGGSGSSGSSGGSGSAKIRLYDKQSIESLLAPYVLYHPSFLPADLADRLWRHLSTHPGFKANEFYLFGNACKSDHETAVFGNGGSSTMYGRLTVYHEVNSDLKIAQMLAEDLVAEEIASQKEGRFPLLPFQASEWVADVVIANRYPSRTSQLMWHLDRMLYIGPQCYVVSLLLGATRDFQLRRGYPAVGNTSPVYLLVLPHNSVCVMRPGTQEEFRHRVGPCATPIDLYDGLEMRINLTFRFRRPDLEQPVCGCGLTMDLRRAFKDVATRGNYIWTCQKSYSDPAGGCSDFYWGRFVPKHGKLEPPHHTRDKAERAYWVAHDDEEKWEYLAQHPSQLPPCLSRSPGL